MLPESSIMLPESSIMLQENIYSTGVTHDDLNIFIVQATGVEACILCQCDETQHDIRDHA
jgi:hypothetical protein